MVCFSVQNLQNNQKKAIKTFLVIGRISLLFVALAVLARLSLTKHKHRVLVKDLGPVSQKS